MQSLFQRYVYDRPIVLLLLTTAMWGSNTVAGRLAVGEMSPMVITCLRWLITCCLLMALFGRGAIAEWPVARARWPYLVMMSLCGFTIFNSIFYYAAHVTSAINLSILQTAIPVFVLIGTVVWRRLKVGLLQVLGLALSAVGILVVATKGNFETLATLTFNTGDLMLIGASFFSAIYALALVDRPKTSAMSFFIFIAFGAFLTSLPMLLVEAASGFAMMPTARGWAILVYIAIVPSFLGQICFIRSVELLGAGRSGIFLNLTPVLGSLMAVLILNETFGAYQAVSLALVLGGIFIAEYRQTSSGPAIPPGGR